MSECNRLMELIGSAMPRSPPRIPCRPPSQILCVIQGISRNGTERIWTLFVERNNRTRNGLPCMLERNGKPRNGSWTGTERTGTEMAISRHHWPPRSQRPAHSACLSEFYNFCFFEQIEKSLQACRPDPCRPPGTPPGRRLDRTGPDLTERIGTSRDRTGTDWIFMRRLVIWNGPERIGPDFPCTLCHTITVLP